MLDMKEIVDDRLIFSQANTCTDAIWRVLVCFHVSNNHSDFGSADKQLKRTIVVKSDVKKLRHTNNVMILARHSYGDIIRGGCDDKLH